MMRIRVLWQDWGECSDYWSCLTQGSDGETRPNLYPEIRKYKEMNTSNFINICTLRKYFDTELNVKKCINVHFHNSIHFNKKKIFRL